MICPVTIGPMKGPDCVIAIQMPLYNPRSCRKKTSAIEPAPTAMDPEAPKPCNIYKNMSDANSGDNFKSTHSRKNLGSVCLGHRAGNGADERDEHGSQVDRASAVGIAERTPDDGSDSKPQDVDRN